MPPIVRVDNDIHQAAEAIIGLIEECSRPSKQQLMNQTLRIALKRKLRTMRRRRKGANARG